MSSALGRWTFFNLRGIRWGLRRGLRRGLGKDLGRGHVILETHMSCWAEQTMDHNVLQGLEQPHQLQELLEW